MAELMMFQPGKAFMDSYNQGKAGSLAKIAMTDPTRRQSALADLAGLDPQAATSMKKEFDAQEQEQLKLVSAAFVGADDNQRNQMWPGIKAKWRPRFQALGSDIPDDWKQALPTIQAIAGSSQEAMPADIRTNQWYLKQLGYKPGSKEEQDFLRMRAGQIPKAVPYGFKYDEQGNVWVEDRNQGNIRPGQFGGQNPPPAEVSQGADPMASYLERIRMGGEVLAANNVPPDQINAWKEAEFAKAQQELSTKGVTFAPPAGTSPQPPQQARVSVKPEAPKAPDAPSGYRFRADGGLEAIPGGPADTAVKPKKPWPTAALKVYSTMSGDLQVADSLDTMMADMEALFSDPKFELGPIQNKQYEFANWSGNSTPQSRAYAKLAANFEKMRNDSLRLNKGVQTDGDAQRAWNEIMANMNDKELVMARLADIKRYNDFALAEKQYQLEVFEEQYGKPNATRPPADQPAGGGNKPEPGDVVKGYRFKGGDPSKPQSWEKL